MKRRKKLPEKPVYRVDIQCRCMWYESGKPVMHKGKAVIWWPLHF